MSMSVVVYSWRSHSVLKGYSGRQFRYQDHLPVALQSLHQLISSHQWLWVHCIILLGPHSHLKRNHSKWINLLTDCWQQNRIYNNMRGVFVQRKRTGILKPNVCPNPKIDRDSITDRRESKINNCFCTHEVISKIYFKRKSYKISPVGSSVKCE